MKHLTSLFDLTTADVTEIFETVGKLKSQLKSGERPALLQGHVLTQIFEKPSLRTRVSFESAMAQLGGSGIFFTAKDAGMNGRESTEDVARVLSGYADVIVLRTFSQKLIEKFAAAASCPVVNGLSDDFHPCQALTDFFTMQEVFGGLGDQRLVYVGDGNNVVQSLAIAAAMLNVPFTVSSPAGYEVSSDFLQDLNQRFPNAEIVLEADPHSAVADAGVIYTDVWASMGQESESDTRKQAFASYQVNSALLQSAPDGCKFMHCLPAKRGIEVTDEVIDGPNSIVFQQAENRMHLAKGLFVWLLAQ
jgi:ornithine carbamoyltransferase